MDPDATVTALFAADADPENADPDEVTELLRALHGWVLGGGYVPEGAVAACTRMADRGHGYGQTVAEACQDAAEREARAVAATRRGRG